MDLTFWDKQINRATELSSQSAAKELLNFYASVLSAQRRVYEFLVKKAVEFSDEPTADLKLLTETMPIVLKAVGDTGSSQLQNDMVQIAGLRVSQLKAESGFANAGLYDPQSIGGTHVIYVLHDSSQPELYGLPAHPVIPPTYTVWKWLAKPTGLFMAMLGVLAVFFHRLKVGPKWPQPLDGGPGTQPERDEI